MIEIYITPEDITKYLYLIVLFNATFPKLLEKSGIMINIEAIDGNVSKLPNEYFIHLYDHYGLNQVAE